MGIDGRLVEALLWTGTGWSDGEGLLREQTGYRTLRKLSRPWRNENVPRSNKAYEHGARRRATLDNGRPMPQKPRLRIMLGKVIMHLRSESPYQGYCLPKLTRPCISLRYIVSS